MATWITREITPEDAVRMLPAGGIGRLPSPARERRVLQYARDMTRGAWQLTDDSFLVTGPDGRCRDGLLRLGAIIKSGTTQLMQIMQATEEELDAMGFHRREHEEGRTTDMSNDDERDHEEERANAAIVREENESEWVDEATEIAARIIYAELRLTNDLHGPDGWEWLSRRQKVVWKNAVWQALRTRSPLRYERARMILMALVEAAPADGAFGSCQLCHRDLEGDGSHAGSCPVAEANAWLTEEVTRDGTSS